MSSQLLRFPPDIMAGITHYLAFPDLLELYIAVPQDIRHTLTHRGGVKSIETKLDGDRPSSFPFLCCRFATLSSLSLTHSATNFRTFTIGSFQFLPPSLTSINFCFNQAFAGWLAPTFPLDITTFDLSQPDDGTLTFRVLHLDELFPKLRSLVMTTTRKEFNTVGFPSKAYESLSSEVYAENIVSRMVLRRNIVWTREMFEEFFSHLPKTLTRLHTPSYDPNIAAKGDTEGETAQRKPGMFALLPPHLEELRLIDYNDPNRMSELLPSHIASLTSLNLRVSLESSFFDAPLPTHLTSLVMEPGWRRDPASMNVLFGYLPHTLLTLHIMEDTTLDVFSVLPPKLTSLGLQIGVGTALPADCVGKIPPSVTHLNLAIRGWLQEGTFAALPRNLKRLDLRDSLRGSQFQKLDDVRLLPATLTHLRLDAAGQSMAPEHLPSLPLSLRSLHLPHTKWTGDAAALLPQQLTDLELTSVNWPDTVVPLLPRGLTNLTLTLDATGSLIPPNVENIAEDVVINSIVAALPPLLKLEDAPRQSFTQSGTSWGWRGRQLRVSLHELSHLPTGAHSIDMPITTISESLVRDAVRSMDTSSTENKESSPASTLTASLTRFRCNLTSFPVPFLHALKSVTDLDLEKCYMLLHRYDLLDAAKSAVRLPEGLTRLNMPAFSNHAALLSNSAGFPAGMTELRFGRAHPEILHKITHLSNLKTLNVAADWKNEDIPLLPRTITDLKLQTNMLTSACFKSLPPGLVILDSNIAALDVDLVNLPTTLTKLRLCQFGWTESAPLLQEYLARRPSPEKFEYPQTLFQLAKASRFLPEMSHNIDNEEFKSLSESELATRRQDWLKDMSVESGTFATTPAQVSLDLRRFLTPNLKELVFSAPFIVWKPVMANLPRNLTKLDISQFEGVPDEMVPLLPPTLIELHLEGGELTLADVKFIPRSVTVLTFQKLPGRLNALRAPLFPPDLVTLKLGIVALTDEGLPGLSRAITTLEARNSTLITDAAVPHFPPNLTRLSLPTTRMTYYGAAKLPKSITSLKLGISCATAERYIMNAISRRKD